MAANVEQHTVTFLELYGSGNLCDTAAASHNLNLSCLKALDPRYKKDGSGALDFSRKTDRGMAPALIESEDPDWVIGAPPCKSRRAL